MVSASGESLAGTWLVLLLPGEEIRVLGVCPLSDYTFDCCCFLVCGGWCAWLSDLGSQSESNCNSTVRQEAFSAAAALALVGLFADSFLFNFCDCCS